MLVFLFWQAATAAMDGIINTVSANMSMAPYMGLLKPNGKMIMVGLPVKPLEIPPFDLIMGKTIPSRNQMFHEKFARSKQDPGARLVLHQFILVHEPSETVK